MMRAVIIDDEINGLKSLELLIEKYVADVKVIAATVDPVKGIELINNYRPDIVFLDINMPVLNGFDMLQKLEFKEFYLVFTTAYSEYALRALKESATDYLLKPVDLDDLVSAIERVKNKMQSKENPVDVTELVKQFYKSQKGRVAVPGRTAVEYVMPNTIAYIEACSNYSLVTLMNGTVFTAYRGLKEYELLLCHNDSSFIRIHNSYIVNVNCITRYLKEDGGYAVVQDKKSIPISKHRKKDFFKLINFRP